MLVPYVADGEISDRLIAVPRTIATPAVSRAGLIAAIPKIASYASKFMKPPLVEIGFGSVMKTFTCAIAPGGAVSLLTASDTPANVVPPPPPPLAAAIEAGSAT